MFDQDLAKQAIEGYFGNLPHPSAPSVKVNDYPAFARIAMMMKGELPEGGDVEHAYHMLKGVELSPAEFEAGWAIARPIANRLLGRDPEIHELKFLASQHPEEYHHLYSSLPHPRYPEVKVGDLVPYHHAAEPLADKYAKRAPNVHELVRFAAGGYDVEDIAAFYRNEF